MPHVFSEPLAALLEAHPHLAEWIGVHDGHELWGGPMSKQGKPYFPGGHGMFSLHLWLAKYRWGKLPTSRIIVVECEHKTCLLTDHWMLYARRDMHGKDPEKHRKLRRELESMEQFSMPEYVARRATLQQAYADGWRRCQASMAALLARERARRAACTCGAVERDGEPSV